jgi:hypothetical protein
MSRRSPGYYAFRCHTREPGLRRLVVVDGKPRTDGQLLRFSSHAARTAWLADTGEEVREACATRTLPAGWRVEDALNVPVESFSDDADTWDDTGDAEGEE